MACPYFCVLEVTIDLYCLKATDVQCGIAKGDTRDFISLIPLNSKRWFCYLKV